MTIVYPFICTAKVTPCFHFINLSKFSGALYFLCFKLVTLVIIAVYGLRIERLATLPVIKTAHLRADGVDIAWSLWWIAYSVVGADIPLLWQYICFKFVKENRRY